MKNTASNGMCACVLKPGPPVWRSGNGLASAWAEEISWLGDGATTFTRRFACSTATPYSSALRRRGVLKGGAGRHGFRCLRHPLPAKGRGRATSVRKP